MGVAKNVDYKKAVYGLHNGDGTIRYVGVCRYVPERVSLHKYRAKGHAYDHLPLYAWIHEVGLGNVQAVILEKVTSDSIDFALAREQFWIKQYAEAASEDLPLLNCTQGGRTVANMLRGAAHPRYGAKLTEAHKQAMAEGRKKRLDSMTEAEQIEAKAEMAQRVKEAFANRLPEVVEQHMAKQISGQNKWLSETDPAQIHYTQSKGPHVRYHVNRDIVNENCVHCIEAEKE